ncbi:hypothetical protein N5A93_00665 [Roseovarius sp. EGI FJ00037]|uniref:hypothetical protein n=1 Tax=Roseovarius TaxID=74030 RepID=UPI0022A7E897|nr:hypothetical protein [Roseovarius sp. EGI FJ00037]MCZ0810732.1 hypothetical protein [Roseovarius sp. EGI FJ00037]
MSSGDEIDEIKARLQKVERQARNAKGWLIVLGIGVLLSLFGGTAWRIWQVSTACDTIVAQHPDLSHSECMKRVHEA